VSAEDGQDADPDDDLVSVMEKNRESSLITTLLLGFATTCGTTAQAGVHTNPARQRGQVTVPQATCGIPRWRVGFV